MTKKIVLVFLALGMLPCLTAAKCGSREHVQSVEYMNKCVEYHRRKLFPQAKRDCSKAVSLDPEYDKAQHALAMVYIETKEYDQSARHLQKAISLEGEIAMYHYQLGEVYQWMGKPDQAVEPLKRAIEIDPKLYKAHYRLGLAYSKLDDPQQALQKFTDTLNQNAMFFEGYRELGALYLDYGFASQAEQVLAEGIKALQGRNEEVAVLHHFKGTALAEKGDYESAVKEFRAALENKPDMEDAMFSLGWSYSYVNPENAKIWLQKFISSASQGTRQDYLSAAQARLTEIEVGTPF